MKARGTLLLTIFTEKKIITIDTPPNNSLFVKWLGFVYLDNKIYRDLLVGDLVIKNKV